MFPTLKIWCTCPYLHAVKRNLQNFPESAKTPGSAHSESPRDIRDRQGAHDKCEVSYSSHVLYRIVVFINTFTHKVQRERGNSNMWFASSLNSSNPVPFSRFEVDLAAKNLSTFIEHDWSALGKEAIIDTAVILDFVTEIQSIRAMLDAAIRPDAAAGLKAFAAYTRGIEAAHNLVAQMASKVTPRSTSFMFLVISDFLEYKEALGVQRGRFSAVLSSGEVHHESLVVCPAPPIICSACNRATDSRCGLGLLHVDRLMRGLAGCCEMAPLNGAGVLVQDWTLYGTWWENATMQHQTLGSSNSNQFV